MAIKQQPKLPSFSISDARANLSSERFAQLLTGIINQLALILESSEAEPDRTTISFVDTYLRDEARRKLIENDFEASDTLKKLSGTVRGQVLQIVSRMNIQKPTAISAMTLQNVVLVYGSNKNSTSEATEFVKKTMEAERKGSIEDGFKRLTELYSKTLQAQYTPNKTEPVEFLQARTIVLRCINSFLSAGSAHVNRIFVENRSLLSALGDCYHNVLPEIARSQGGFHAGEANWQKPWLELKVAILDALHAVFTFMIDATFTLKTMTPENSFETILSLINNSSVTSESAPSGRRWFVNQSMMTDYQHIHDLTGRLRKVTTTEGQMLDAVLKSMSELIGDGVSGDDSAVQEILLRNKSVNLSSRTGKGKGKAIEVCTEGSFLVLLRLTSDTPFPSGPSSRVMRPLTWPWSRSWAFYRMKVKNSYGLHYSIRLSMVPPRF